jgi:hypothetical protein
LKQQQQLEKQLKHQQHQQQKEQQQEEPTLQSSKPAGDTYFCTSCAEVLDKSAFSNNQIKKPSQRRCKDCCSGKKKPAPQLITPEEIEEFQPPPEWEFIFGKFHKNNERKLTHSEVIAKESYFVLFQNNLVADVIVLIISNLIVLMKPTLSFHILEQPPEFVDKVNIVLQFRF